MIIASTALVVTVLVGAAEPPKPAPAATPPAQPAPPAAAPTTPVERARIAVAKLKGSLLTELKKQLDAGGPAKAINVCGDMTTRIRGEVSNAELQIGRTSSKLRNPKNTAPAWVAPLLAELEAAPADKRGPREVKLPDGGLGYVEPLNTAPLCLACHGAPLAPEVQAAIAAKYPADKAVGFKEGDLRGLVWVEVKGAVTPRP
ncbi:MAG: DUF3365 domain-containing protein [Deltaproteobacteria bacterium]|nr:DUF3365 domain-containing protein [Deltaproteobacteria bacterium]